MHALWRTSDGFACSLPETRLRISHHISVLLLQLHRHLRTLRSVQVHETPKCLLVWHFLLWHTRTWLHTYSARLLCAAYKTRLGYSGEQEQYHHPYLSKQSETPDGYVARRNLASSEDLARHQTMLRCRLTSTRH
jgi:hypothetical protein